MAGLGKTGHGSASALVRFSFFSGPPEVAGPRLALVLAVFFLTVVGLVMVFSASSIEAINEGASPTSYVVKQVVFMLVGVALCVALALAVPYDLWLTRLLDVFWLATIFLLFLTAAIGTVGLGAQRWLQLGPVSFQPSEFAKLAFVLMTARIMYQGRTQSYDFNRFTLMILLLVVAPLGVLYATQSDLGTTAICLVGVLAVVFFAGTRTSIIVALGIGLGVFVVLAVVFVGYRSDRMAFLNPEADYYGNGYQLVRSFYAFGEGGLFGVGLGNSSEKYLYLPEAETDFIFAIVAEELGLVGALAVIIAFLVVLWAGLRIAGSAPDLFGAMVAGGCTVMLVFQAFLNIACVTGLLPTTGKPLPFISSGGSSLIGSFMLVGVILSVSFASGGTRTIYDRRREDLRVVRTSSSGRQGASSAGKQRRQKRAIAQPSAQIAAHRSVPFSLLSRS